MATVKITQREYDILVRKAKEVDDYIQTSKIMREEQMMHMDHGVLAYGPYSEGWLDCFREWNKTLLRVMAASSAKRGNE